VNKDEAVMFFLAIICVMSMILYGTLLAEIEVPEPKYDCSLASFHPDYTQAMRQECSKGRVQYERK
jgi:hypothetical protein